MTPRSRSIILAVIALWAVCIAFYVFESLETDWSLLDQFENRADTGAAGKPTLKHDTLTEEIDVASISTKENVQRGDDHDDDAGFGELVQGELEQRMENHKLSDKDPKTPAAKHPWPAKHELEPILKKVDDEHKQKNNKQKKPAAPAKPKLKNIFVGIASYRDNECHLTIQNLYKFAEHPERIWVGACEQHDPAKDEPCTLIDYYDCEAANPDSKHGKFCNFIKNQVVITRMFYKEATGPTGGRNCCEKMLRDDSDFYLQIDSHMHFEKNWDTRFINMWNRIGDPFSLISSYPLDYSSQGTDFARDKVPVICSTKFLEGRLGIVKHNGASVVDAPPGRKPFRVPFWAAGLSFAPAELIRECPFDPHTPYLFDGEEFGTGSRYWTHGYDIYAPSENLIFHHYSSKEDVRHKYWEVDWAERFKTMIKSEHRVLHMLGKKDLPSDFSMYQIAPGQKYGLGVMRSMESFLKMTGLDLEAQKEVDLCDMYRNKKYIPHVPRCDETGECERRKSPEQLKAEKRRKEQEEAAVEKKQVRKKAEEIEAVLDDMRENKAKQKEMRFAEKQVEEKRVDE